MTFCRLSLVIYSATNDPFLYFQKGTSETLQILGKIKRYGSYLLDIRDILSERVLRKIVTDSEIDNRDKQEREFKLEKNQRSFPGGVTNSITDKYYQWDRNISLGFSY